MKILVAMSGGVDSSVAAALLQREGHQVVGVTLKLWGGEGDRGCCSVSDVDDARRVADALGIDHHVFNYSQDFEADVVAPYVAAHAAGQTPNPCVACNRHLKFDRLTERARVLGFEALATGHHVRLARRRGAVPRLLRGADAAKDQSYVLYMLDAATLGYVQFPVGDYTKAEVRALAQQLGLRTADKPDSQDVCFISSVGGRAEFLANRIAFTPGRVVDLDGMTVGRVDAVELVTIGQRRGLGLAGGAEPRYVVATDRETATITVGRPVDLATARVALTDLRWADAEPAGEVLAQSSAHGEAKPGRYHDGVLHWSKPQRRVAPGQAVVLYDGDEVLGGGLAFEPSRPNLP